MTTTPDATPKDAAIDASVAESSSYDLLKKRLEVQGSQLLAKAQALNAARVEQFGQRDQQLLMRTRARTEHNCVARDLAYIGGNRLLFGYNVFMGLRRETRVEDVFAIYELAHQQADAAGTPESDELVQIPLAGSFLDDPRFIADFNELYTYYKQATLQLLRPTQDFLLAFLSRLRRWGCRLLSSRAAKGPASACRKLAKVVQCRMHWRWLFSMMMKF